MINFFANFGEIAYEPVCAPLLLEVEPQTLCVMLHIYLISNFI